MAKIISGKEVADALTARTKKVAIKLKGQGITPSLAIVRCGENPSDISYERGAVKKCEAADVAVRSVVLPEEIPKDELISVIDDLNEDREVHGVLLFRPLPDHLKKDESEVCERLAPSKDVDGMTSMSYAGVMTGRSLGFPPCTPAACLECFDYYGINLDGANVALIGRSLVVGRPLSLMMTGRNATVTMCHTHTKDIGDIISRADIVISAAGKTGSLKSEYLRPNQVVIDLSMNYDPNKNGGKGGMVGDAIYDEAVEIVGAITPVPGGVGAVTSCVLASHVVQSAAEGKQI